MALIGGSHPPFFGGTVFARMGHEAEAMLDHGQREWVLLVEDDPALSAALAELLRTNWEVETASNASEAWNRITEREAPHIILSDVSMPGESGLELLQRVRNGERTRYIPFILVSGVNDTEMVVKGLELGANDYVTKPVNPAILQARMSTHLRAAAMQRRLERQNALLARLAAFDDLTGVYNRRTMTDTLESEVSRSIRYGHPLAVLLLDLDHFKQVNDSWGHSAGDDVLRAFVHRIAPILRSTDVLCRYGGEEFCIIMPDTSQNNAIQAAERMRRLVAAEPFLSGDVSIPMTVSIGVACLPPDFSDSPEVLLERADRALYKAKNQGRNRIVMYDAADCQVED